MTCAEPLGLNPALVAEAERMLRTSQTVNGIGRAYAKDFQRVCDALNQHQDFASRGEP